MKKKYYLIPFLIVFATPWMHRIAFENIVHAIPEMDRGGAHFAALCLAGIAGFFMMVMAGVF